MADERDESEKLVGAVLANTYRIEKMINEGGMGAIYRARHIRTGGTCAVKILHSRSAQNSELYERFQDEARIISSLHHPNIVTVMDLDTDQTGCAFIVMELLEGEDLQDRLERLGKLPLEDALDLVKQIGSALQAAHQRGVIHRDLKPRNIFLAQQDVGGKMIEIAKVIDFGVSKIPRPSDRATKDLLVLGTPRYMAPEGAMGQNSQIDGRSDQWSVAVILYRMLAGKLPFDQESVIDLFKQVINDDPTPLETLVPDLPLNISVAVKRALSKKKEARFPAMMEFLAALELPEAEKAKLRRKRAAAAKAAQASASASHSGSAAPVAPRVALLRMLGFAGVGALVMALVLFPLVRMLSRRPAQASEMLLSAEQALTEERWSDAQKLADRVLDMKGVPENVRATAEITSKRAKNGSQSEESLKRLDAALSTKDYDTALSITRDLPPTLRLHRTAQQQYETLMTLVVGSHIQKAEAARTAGNCAEVQTHVDQILAAAPDNEGALQARWRPCASFAGVVPPGPKKLAGYPPVRDVQGSSLDLPGDFPGGQTSLVDIDRYLREAQIAHQQGRFWAAISLAHVGAGTPLRSPTAWRIVGSSACAIKNATLVGLALEHLDPGSREMVRAACEKIGFLIR